MIRFQEKSRQITLAVRDLVELDSIQPLRAEPLLGIRARAGTRAHNHHRSEREEAGLPGYRAEYPVEYRTGRRGYRIIVQGRIDGLYCEGERLVVEEVKSVILTRARFQEEHLARATQEHGAYSDYRRQLELYVFFLASPGDGDPGDAGDADGARTATEERSLPPHDSVMGRLVFRNLARTPTTGEDGDRGTGQRSVISLDFDPDLARLKEWIEARLDSVIDGLEGEVATGKVRRAAAGRLQFPFPHRRAHQEELMEEIRASLEAGEHLLISAPTGVGKTVAVLQATLGYALKEGLRIFYLTAKTTQRRLVAETLEKIAGASGWLEGDSEGPSHVPPFHAVVLRARAKICPNLPEEGFIFCHEDFCRYARDYAAKIDRYDALGKFLSGPVALPDMAARLGREAEACPYELSLDASLRADVVVGDYNHVFDPESNLRRLFEDRRGRASILIIDEAHNLHQRGRDSYSPGISRREVRALLRWARQMATERSGGGDAGLLEDLTEWLKRLEHQFATFSAHGRNELGDPPTYEVELDPELVRDLSAELESIRTGALLLRKNSPGAGAGLAGGATDPLRDFAAKWRRFASTFQTLEGGAFHLLYDKSRPRDGHRIRILCLDPAVALKKSMARFHSVIALSATLEPLPFYRDTLGFPPRRTRTVALPSPFPPENRKVLVWDRVSTYYRSRDRDAGKVAQLIGEIRSLKKGNYLVCFSSYSYLREVLAHIPEPIREQCIVQTPGMSEEERDHVLELLGTPGAAWALLAVQGGIFTEGVDYPRQMLIGVVVVGPGLPAVSFNQELTRKYYEDRYQEGFEYAYLYPGMNRVIQCAGRVIRSETDVGVIILVGKRFAQGQYSRLFPSEWYRTTPAELISRDLMGDLKEFWDQKQN